jgi:hemolysin III
MSEKKNIPSNQYTATEELANGITHGIGVLLSIAGLVILIITASLHGDVRQMVSFTIFGSTMIMLYSASTLYHSISNPLLKAGLKKLDHSAIFLLIAGTYTPFLTVHLRSTLGWSLFAVIWSLAVIGIVIKVFYMQKVKKLSTGLYLTMGWLCVIAMQGLFHILPIASFALLIAGGLFYTAGVIFYAWKKLPYHHAVWHLFVLGGSTSHFFSVLKSV